MAAGTSGGIAPLRGSHSGGGGAAAAGGIGGGDGGESWIYTCVYTESEKKRLM